MSSSNYRVRRATLDDLVALRSLWSSMHLAEGDLEKRLTEFQAAINESGKLVGAIGFQVHERHARIHSEVFDDFSVADEVRPLFWQRIQALAANHGVARLWTHESAPFWTHSGLQPASTEVLQRLPPAWAGAASPWLTLQLKDENAIASVEKEMAVLMQTERQRTAAKLESAKTLKTVVTVIGFLVALAILAAAGYVYLRQQQSTLVPH